MSDRLPPPWSQSATPLDILEVPPPAVMQPPIRRIYPPLPRLVAFAYWFWFNLRRSRPLRPEEMVTFRESLAPVRPRDVPQDRRLLWWWYADRALPALGALLVGVVLLAWFLEAVS